MIELANKHQGKDEPELDYINNWRNLSLNCKDTLSEISVSSYVFKSCIENYATFFNQYHQKTFGELVTRAHEIKMSFNCKEDEYLGDAKYVDDGDDDDATP
ncbi:UNVERIFIED_CONTAM: hypothetical protein Slati_2521000 [Sesamum latifolium]|uniref:Uncharacterized protein n=1 Tax=Sesamum latifolium TaxID=2727402 RepID=A0AAW2WF09_9LAMI